MYFLTSNSGFNVALLVISCLKNTVAQFIQNHYLTFLSHLSHLDPSSLSHSQALSLDTGTRETSLQI